MHKLSFSLFALAIFSLSAFANENDSRIEKQLSALEQTAKSYAEVFATPGVAIAVVTPNSEHYLTFGVREVGKPGRIDTSTIFQLASVSKPITSTFASLLISRHALKWDSAITSLLPGFTFSDKSISKRTSLRDLLDQRSGLPGGTGDFLETLGYPQKHILKQMQFVDTAENFQKQWAYANFGVTLGGVGASAVTGTSFETALRNELLRPAGMRSAFVGYKRLNQIHNRAHLHFTIQGNSRPLFVRNADAQAPGGGVNASIRDLAAFIQLHLNQGRVGKKQLIDPKVLQETYEPRSQTATGHYGIGWNVQTAPDGSRVISHSGAFAAGSRTVVTIWPKLGIGIAVLSNNFPSFLPEAVADAFYQLYTVDHVRSGTLQKYVALNRAAFDISDDIHRLHDSQDLGDSFGGHPLEAYAGFYQNDYLGPIEIRLEPETNSKKPTLIFHGGPNLKPVKIQSLGKSKLVSSTPEGEAIYFQFSEFQNGHFQQLDFDELKPIGWQTLKRISPSEN